MSQKDCVIKGVDSCVGPNDRILPQNDKKADKNGFRHSFISALNFYQINFLQKNYKLYIMENLIQIQDFFILFEDNNLNNSEQI